MSYRTVGDAGPNNEKSNILMSTGLFARLFFLYSISR